MKGMNVRTGTVEVAEWGIFIRARRGVPDPAESIDVDCPTIAPSRSPAASCLNRLGPSHESAGFKLAIPHLGGDWKLASRLWPLASNSSSSE